VAVPTVIAPEGDIVLHDVSCGAGDAHREFLILSAARNDQLRRRARFDPDDVEHAMSPRFERESRADISSAANGRARCL
jgi:hypothetical protein